MMVWIDHVKSDVALNNLGHQPVYGTPASGNRVQNVRAFGAFFKRSFDSFNLPLDTANPIQELVLIANDMCQFDQSPSKVVLPSQSPSLFGGCPEPPSAARNLFSNANIPG